MKGSFILNVSAEEYVRYQRNSFVNIRCEEAAVRIPIKHLVNETNFNR